MKDIRMDWLGKFSNIHRVEKYAYLCMILHTFLMVVILMVCRTVPEWAAEPPVPFIYGVYIFSLVFCYVSMRFYAARNIDYFEQAPKKNITLEAYKESKWPLIIFSCALALWAEYYLLRVWTGEAEMAVKHLSMHVDDMLPGTFYFYYIIYNLFVVYLMHILSKLHDPSNRSEEKQ